MMGVSRSQNIIAARHCVLALHVSVSIPTTTLIFRVLLYGRNTSLPPQTSESSFLSV